MSSTSIALDAEEAAIRMREDARQTRRALMTANEKDEETERIEEFITTCRTANSIEDANERRQLIERGLIPIIDSFTLERGIAVEDVAVIHGKCVSRAALVEFLDRRRDEVLLPNIGTGYPLQEQDMINLGLDPMQYRFFNDTLPRIYPMPEVEPPEDEEDEYEEENTNPDGTFISLATGSDNYLQRLSQSAMRFDDFVALLDTPIHYRPVDEMRSYFHKFDADDMTLVANLVLDFQESTADFNDDFEGNIRRARLRTLLLRKIDYLFSVWRSNWDLHYNPFTRNNTELRFICTIGDAEVVEKFFRYARHLHLYFFAHTDNLRVAFSTLLHDAGDNPFLTQTLRTLQTVMRPYINNNRRWLEEHATFNHVLVSTEFDLWASRLTRTLAEISLDEFRLYVRDRFGRLTFHALYPNNMSGFLIQQYRPEDYDLIRLIANEPEKIHTLVANYKIDLGYESSFDVSKHDFRAIRVLLYYPMTLEQLLLANHANELEHRTFITLSDLDLVTKLELYNSARNRKSRQVLKTYLALSDTNIADQPALENNDENEQ